MVCVAEKARPQLDFRLDSKTKQRHQGLASLQVPPLFSFEMALLCFFVCFFHFHPVSFLAILQILGCAFLLFQVFQCFSPYSRTIFIDYNT